MLIIAFLHTLSFGSAPGTAATFLRARVGATGCVCGSQVWLCTGLLQVNVSQVGSFAIE